MTERNTIGAARRWLPTAAVVLVGALSLLVLELDHRRSAATLRQTVSGVDNLTRARLLVMQAYLSLEQLTSGDPTADGTQPLADIQGAIHLIDDLREGRTSLLSVGRSAPLADQELIAAADDYIAALSELRERIGDRGETSPVAWRVAFAAVETRGDALERRLYEALARRLDTETRYHRFWFFGWSGFLVVAGFALVASRTQRGRAEARRQAAETSRARSEARFRALIEEAGEIVMILTPDGTIRYESPAVERVLGYTPSGRVGQNALWVVHPGDRDVVEEAFRRAVGSGEPVSVEYRVRHKDGTWRFFSATAKSLLNDPAVQGVVVNSRDITALRESAERLRQAQKMEAIGRLAGGIAHDFNNLLLVIKANADMMMADLAESSPSREDLREIQLAAKRAADLTRQLLAFSRQQVLQAEVVDLNDTISELEKMLRRVLGADIEIRTELDPNLGKIRADPGQLQQILMNLVVNARDAMPDGGSLVVETKNEELSGSAAEEATFEVRPGPYVALVISDTGTGIPEAIRHRIFEPFYTTKEHGKGTGLGLSTVYGIVKQSDGYIWVSGEEGQGTTFKIYFPRVDAQVVPPKAVAAAGPAEPARILLVEDEPAVRATARRLLERLGHAVVEVESGEEALRIVERENGCFDLLFTDVVMPGMSGRELADEVIGRWPHVRVLYSSGYTDEAVLRKGALDGTAAFLQKPYLAAALAQKIAEILSRERPNDVPRDRAAD